MAMILNISISDHIRTLGKIGPRFYNSENRKSDHEPTTLKIGPKFEYSEKNGHRSNNSEKSDMGRTTRKNWFQIRLLGKISSKSDCSEQSGYPKISDPDPTNKSGSKTCGYAWAFN